MSDERSDGRPVLSVIVPVYNETRTVDELLQRVLDVPLDKQVVVVDDGSTDGTGTILQRRENDGRVQLRRHQQNRGKGAAIRTGLEVARARLTIVQDADLEYDPQDYPRLIAPLLAGDAQVVYGSRYCRGAPGARHWSVCRAGVWVLNQCVWWLYGQRLTDQATCYKVLSTELLSRLDLQCERFEFCAEVTAKVCRLGLKIHEVPIRYDARTVADGKKLRWRDGASALACLWRWRRWRGSSVAC